MEVKNIQISDSLSDIARVGVVFFKQLANGPVSTAMRQRMEELAAELQRSLGGRRLAQLEPVARNRKLYRLVGIDPTKDRPSSEKLLRRVVKGKPLPKVNKLVDAMNYVSLRLQCPMGVYDWDRIVPPVLVRIGRPNEGYYGLSNSGPSKEGEEPSRDLINMHGRLVLVDGEGLFGNPSHDSERSRVTLGTVRAMMVAWAPAEAPRKFLESVIEEVTELCEEHCDAKVATSGIL